MTEKQQEDLKKEMAKRRTVEELLAVLEKLQPALISAIESEGRILSASRFTLTLTGKERQMHQTSISLLVGSHTMLNGVERYLKCDLTDEEFLSAILLKQ